MPNLSPLIERVLPAVVSIKAYSTTKSVETPGLPEELKHLFQANDDTGVPGKIPSSGSGFFVTKVGHVVTSYHLVVNKQNFDVTTSEGKRYKAKLLGLDPIADLALLKISGEKFYYLEFSSEERPPLGTWLLSLGSPFGFDFSADLGIVSGHNRVLPARDRRYFVPHWQSNLSMNPGNSGGPLLDMDGRVLGITTQIYTNNTQSIGLSFAVPAPVAQFVVAQLLEGPKVLRGRYDFELADTSSTPAAAKVASPGKSPLLEGDIIVEFNGYKIHSAAELRYRLGLTMQGQQIAVVVHRKGRSRNLMLQMR